MGSIGQDFNNDFDIGINRWPDTLPECPLLKFSEQQQLNIISFKPEVGTTKLRRRCTAVGTITSLQFKMDDEQISIFDTFFRVTLKDGADGFQMQHPVTKLNYWWMFNKNEGPRIDRMTPRMYLVAFDLLRLIPAIPNAWGARVRFNGRGNLTIDGSKAPWSSATFNGRGGLSARGSLQDTYLSAQFGGIGNLYARDSRQYSLESRFEGTGNVTTDLSKQTYIGARFSGQGNLAVFRQYEIAVRFMGRAQLSMNISRSLYQIGVRFAGVGNLYARQSRYQVQARFGGTGNLSMNFYKFAASRFNGSGNMRAGPASLQKPTASRFNGSGNMRAGAIIV